MKPSMCAAVFIGVVVTALPAWADWVAVGSAEGASYYVDATTTTPTSNGKGRRIWTMWDFNPPRRLSFGMYVSVLQYLELDCLEKTQKTLTMRFFDGHMGQGKLVASDTNKYEEADYILPNSANSVVLDAICH